MAKLSHKELEELVKDQSQFFMVLMAERKGTQLFATKLEYTYFPPRSPANDNFHITIIEWEELLFYLVQVPRQAENICKELATSFGMRLVDGVPNVMDASGLKPFPIEGDNVWTLEGQFTGDETAEVKKIFDNDQEGRTHDLRTDTIIRQGKLEELDEWMIHATEWGSFSPVMNILFGGDRRLEAKEVFVAQISGTNFAVCTIGQNKIIGLYTIPSCRRNGAGEKLLLAALTHCVKTGNVPVQIEVLSASVMRIIERLPADLRKHIDVRNMSECRDLSVLEAKYLADSEWHKGLT